VDREFQQLRSVAIEQLAQRPGVGPRAPALEEELVGFHVSPKN
jgi:hypothetical protein